MNLSRNYDPVERRTKGGKERNPKGSIKSSKSLQTNNSLNSASCNGVSNNKISGKPGPLTFHIITSVRNPLFSVLYFFSCFQSQSKGNRVSFLLGLMRH